MSLAARRGIFAGQAVLTLRVPKGQRTGTNGGHGACTGTVAHVPHSFSELTTMRLGGPIERYVPASSSKQLVEIVRDADAHAEPVLLVGGGSNLVVGDSGFEGLVVHACTTGMSYDGEILHVDAGVEWDTVVAFALAEGLGGLETLSGIPGSAGGTPVQNVGAYGTLISQFLDHVHVLDRTTGELVTLAGSKCGFGSHRQSIFKGSDRYVIVSIHLRLERTKLSQPLAYEGLAARLGLAVGDVAPVGDVRAAVLAMRRERGMVLNADDHDTWSVGSFFINPVLTEVPSQAQNCPTYPDVAGTKLPAAWLIDRAGFSPGYGKDWGRGSVRLSTRHALAVTNRGDATTLEVMRFAAHIRDGVEHVFGVRLGPECDLVNCSFDD